MKITKRQLRQLIQEELKRTLHEDQGQVSIIVSASDLSAMGLGDSVSIMVRLTDPGGKHTASGTGKKFSGSKDQARQEAQAYIDELRKDNPGAKLDKAGDLDQASLDLIKDLK